MTGVYITSVPFRRHREIEESVCVCERDRVIRDKEADRGEGDRLADLTTDLTIDLFTCVCVCVCMCVCVSQYTGPVPTERESPMGRSDQSPSRAQPGRANQRPNACCFCWCCCCSCSWYVPHNPHSHTAHGMLQSHTQALSKTKPLLVLP